MSKGNKLKTLKPRNLVVQQMIERGQSAGPHKNKKAEHDKKKCRTKVDVDQ